jgi:catechol 2,3-dioxygenase-like lactoylglutathione lyase family enzyme
VKSLAEIALFTDDVERAATFYRGLIGAPPIAEWPGGAVFAVGEVKLLLHARAAEMQKGPPNEDHFAISVDDLDAICAALETDNISLLVGPRDYPWGRSAYFRDPDGRLVELVQA